VKAIVFDLDGTLVDTAPDIAAAINRTLARRGLPELPVDVVEGFTGYGADELVRRSFAAAGAPLDDAGMRAETERYLHHYGEHPADRSVLFKDARPVLEELKRRGFAVGICTNKETELSHTVLAAMELDGFVDAVVGADAVANRKPDPEHLRAILDALGARPGEAVYVGDTAIDARAARAAGVRCAMVQWGSGRDAAEPIWARLECFSDLLDLLPVPAS
jgi:phosphoglycolate phosphatase